jgi:hypothetical protein
MIFFTCLRFYAFLQHLKRALFLRACEESCSWQIALIHECGAFTDFMVSAGMHPTINMSLVQIE